MEILNAKLLDKNDGRSHASICFDCQNAVCKCEWSKDFTPVPGWEAELVYLNKNLTYYVTKCPKHIPDVKREGTAGMLSPLDEREFLRDPVNFINKHSKGDELLLAERHRRGRPKKEEKSA